MASLASEIEKLADLKAKGVLTEEEFTHAKAAVIAGDDADSFEEAGADDDAVPVKSGIGYMTFWSEAFTILEKMGNIPKDHHLEWRQHLACSKQHDGASLRDGLSSTYETEIIFAALMLGVNWTVFTAVVDDDAYAAVRGLELSKARFWLPVVGFLSIVFSWIVIGAVYLVLVMLAPVSDTNLPAFVRSTSVTNCLLIPNVFLLLMFYASSFFFALAVCVASDSGIMLGLSALMFALMVVMLQAFMTPMNIVINAGCFSDVPAIAPRDLAKCSAADVDAAFRRKALATVRKHGKPSGLMFSPAPPSALEELYSGEHISGGNAVRRRRARRVFGMKKRGAVSASIH